MKKILCLWLVLCSITVGYAENLFIFDVPFYQDINDISGSAPDNPTDGNRKPTAIVKVNCTMMDLEFVSDYILTTPEYKSGQYVFFMAAGAQSFEIRKKDGTYLPYKVVFSKYGIKKLKQKMCYKMTISGKDIQYFGHVRVTATPSDANIYVDDVLSGTNGIYEDHLLVGQHKIRVEKDMFETYTDVFDLNRDDTLSQNISLVQTLAHLDIYTDELTDIYIDSVWCATQYYSGVVTIGSHTIEARHGTHEITVHNVDIPSVGRKIHLNMFGSLRLDYSKSNFYFTPGMDTIVPVKKNDMEKRTVYDTVTNALLGKYKVIFNREGCWSKNKRVSIEKDKTTTVSAPKLYKRKAWTCLTYQYSPKSDCGLMLGVSAKVGGYISGRYNIGKPFFKGDFNPNPENNPMGINSWTANGGLIFRFGQGAWFYMGAGYGSYQSDTMNSSIKGPAADAGLMFNLHGKKGRGLVLSIGYNTLVDKTYFKTVEWWKNLTAGIGMML